MGRQPHWVRRNETTRIPARHVVIDTEAHRVPVRGGEVQTFRLAAGVRMERLRSGGWAVAADVFCDPGALWSWVGAFCRPRARTVVWAHNLSYDVRVGRAMTCLARQGWRYVLGSDGDRGAWQRWTRAGATLVLVDSASVFPCPLEVVAGTLGRGKTPLPAEDAPGAVWAEHCRVDAEITATAVQTYLDWLADADLGCWQMTGAGQSWAAWRHRFLAGDVLVHGNEDALQAERRAMWTGRCEAWRHGRVDTVAVYEWDLRAAYATLAAQLEVPVRLVAERRNVSPAALQARRPGVAVLAEVDVAVADPCVPAEVDGRVCWPVGEFRTTLWDAELDLVAEHGLVVDVHRMWAYRTAPALRAYAVWVLGLLSGAEPLPSPVLRLVAKHWSRSLFGRLSMRYTGWEPFGEQEGMDWRRTTLVNAAEGAAGDLMFVGRQVLRSTGEQESPHSLPMVTGYLMAAGRVRLWQAMRAVGEEHLVYVDTDSAVVDPAGHAALADHAAAHPGHGWVCKGRHRGYDVRGPRQLFLGDQTRLAGIPRDAERTGDDTVAGRVWSSLAGQLRAGRPDEVVLADRVWRLRGTDHRRVHTDHGRTTAVVLREGD